MERKRTSTVVMDTNIKNELKIIARKTGVGTIGAAVALLVRDYNKAEGVVA